MDIETIRDYCLCMPEAEESFPFDETTLVFKVGGRIFAILALDRQPGYLCLKCDPEQAIWLREHYTAVEGAFHMNKTHWNGITLGLDMPQKEVERWITHSYELIFARLPRRERERIGYHPNTQ